MHTLPRIINTNYNSYAPGTNAYRTIGHLRSDTAAEYLTVYWKRMKGKMCIAMCVTCIRIKNIFTVKKAHPRTTNNCNWKVWYLVRPRVNLVYNIPFKKHLCSKKKNLQVTEQLKDVISKQKATNQTNYKLSWAAWLGIKKLLLLACNKCTALNKVVLCNWSMPFLASHWYKIFQYCWVTCTFLGSPCLLQGCFWMRYQLFL